jgi:hypothetical protein
MTTTLENDKNPEPVYSRKVIEMLTVANEYCLFLEKAEEYTRESILPFLQKICPLIYLKASLLPEIQDVNEEAAEHFVKEEDWELIFNTLREKFGKDDQFLYVDHHETGNSDPVPSSLAEIFADLYQDLKDFVLLYQKPRKASMEFAVYDCKNLFETHYGFLLVNALQRIHYLIYRENSVSPMNDLWTE